MKFFLIGMPGCGKTTLGRIAADKLGIKFVDMDSEIEKVEGRPISEIFSRDGEGYFRNIETETLKNELSSDGDKIISTGGGIVVREENIELLQNSGEEVVFINRPPEKIAEDIECSQRPLMKNGRDTIFRLYKERHRRYKRACSTEILNDSDLKSAVLALIRMIRSR